VNVAVRDEDKVLEPYTRNACRTVATSHNVSVATTSIASAIVLAVISAITPDEHRDAAQHAGEVRAGPGRVPSVLLGSGAHAASGYDAQDQHGGGCAAGAGDQPRVVA
jgi:uncharacterized membrane protein